MKSSDRTVLLVVGIVGLIAAFWFLVLAPKRQEASDLASQVTSLEAEVAQEELNATAATSAEADFKSNYHELVTLGKAVPVDADTPSLLTQLQTLSARSDVLFNSITLGSGAGGGVTTAPATATEASASLLPIGATVGTAGLPIMPYELQFKGGFFDVADFFGRIDGMVSEKNGKVSVDGRLLTIDNFTMAPLDEEAKGAGDLAVSVNVTSYLSPADQGLTGGATPGGPLTTPLPAVEPTSTEPVTPAAVTP